MWVLLRLDGKTANELDAGVFATKPKPKLQKETTK